MIGDVKMQNEIIKGRCMDCLFFVGKRSGWCKDNREGRKSTRVSCVGYCKDFMPKGV